jgi:hypothetical protein
MEESGLTPMVRAAVKALAFGIGLGLAVCVGLLAVHTYTSRPKPWSKTAVTGEYVGFYIDSKNQLAFLYTLKNNTTQDYTVSGKLAGRSPEGAYVYAGDEFQSSYKGMLIPAGAKVQVAVKTNGYEAKQKCKSDDDACYKGVREGFEALVPNLKGFVVVDDSQRYEIGLPDWRAKYAKGDQEKASK